MDFGGRIPYTVGMLENHTVMPERARVGPLSTLTWHALFVLILCCFGRAACGMIVLGSHDWEGTAHGWTNETDWTTVEQVDVEGNPAGWLQITMASNTDNQVEGIVGTAATNLFAGSWSTNMWVTFDFWVDETALQDDIQLLWSSSTNTTQWGYSLTADGTETWTSLSAPLSYENGWSPLEPLDTGGGSLDEYLADLSTIDWIGVYIWEGSSDQDRIYGLDNFNLMIPEPAETVLLGVALMTSALSWRRKRRRANGTAAQS
jgi:hypothetical protein